MATTPDQRLARLLEHAVAGWMRTRRDESVRRRAIAWLAAHPSNMPDVDALWTLALAGTGSLAAWFERGASAAEWSLDLPLHSVLAGHPFPDLKRWTESPK